MPHAIEIDPEVERWILQSIPKQKLPYNPFYDALDQKIQTGQVNLDELDACYEFGGELGAEIACQLRQNGRPQETQSALTQENFGMDELNNTRELFHEAQEAVNRCIDELLIPEGAKTYLRGTVDNVTLRFSSVGDHLTTVEDDTFIITLNLYDLCAMDRIIPHWFGEPESKEFSRAIRLMLIGHELGHVIGIAMTTSNDVFEERAPVKYGDSGMEGYPITFTIPDGPEREDTVEKLFYDVSKNERFAWYFSCAIQQGLGLSSQVSVDMARVNLLYPYQLGLSMAQLQYILVGLQEQLLSNEFTTPEDRKKYGVNTLNADLYIPLYKNDGMHKLFPFSKRAVESTINHAWQELLLNIESQN